ncbi:MAG TPA: hypothetical protein VFV39_07175 [Limnobacter sp.]|nr:hypothetical protein [Limnobacter sp.]
MKAINNIAGQSPVAGLASGSRASTTLSVFRSNMAAVVARPLQMMSGKLQPSPARSKEAQIARDTAAVGNFPLVP